MAEVVGGHVDFQVVLSHVLFGQRKPGIQNQNIEPEIERKVILSRTVEEVQMRGLLLAVKLPYIN